MDAQWVPVATSVVAALGALATAWTRIKTKELEAQAKQDAQLLQAVIGRQEALELQLAMANRREGELIVRIRHIEESGHAKELEMRELTLRYEALRENYAELLERHRQAETDNRALRDKILKFYLDEPSRKSVPPPKR